MTYTNVLHIYGVSRAGYIPQLFSLRLPNPQVIYELLEQAGARALVYEPSFDVDLSECLLPVHAAEAIEDSDIEGKELPDMPRAVSETDCVFIFHTSGSTSGRPKLVPCSYKWLNTIVSKARHVGKPKTSGRQDVTVWMGSMCHIGQTTSEYSWIIIERSCTDYVSVLIGSLSHGACTIQPTKITFSSEELMDMIHRCGLNRLNQFATFLGNHLRNSRQDPQLLNAIAGLDEVLYSGLPLGKEEEAWAIQNGVPLKVRLFSKPSRIACLFGIQNLFGSTECGAMMLSIGGKERRGALLCPIEGTTYGFFPIAAESDEVQPAYKNTNAQLLELVILSDSGDCPDGSLRHTDGHLHTGDLFLEVEPGCYASQGRVDDWIKSENSLRCDTK
jgi:acyl-coenzyme A synthetase/AMP-(fatty) acid ligase